MSFTRARVPTPVERRERNREEMTAAILDAAREMMRRKGAGALNLRQIAQRVNLTTPALYSYFPNKFAIYDALYIQAIRLMYDYDNAVWEQFEPGWDRLRAWFGARMQFAMDYTELYQLIFSAPVPGFVPSEESVAESQKQLASARRGLTELIDAGVIRPDLPVERTVDVLLAIRHGILAERIGKANVVPADSGRFDYLIDDAISMLWAAWAPESVTPAGEGDARE